MTNSVKLSEQAKEYEAHKNDNDWTTYDLKFGVRVSTKRNLMVFHGMSSIREYYLLSQQEPIAICTLRNGEKILSRTWCNWAQITKAEFDTYKEFDLFPELEHYNEL